MKKHLTRDDSRQDGAVTMPHAVLMIATWLTDTYPVADIDRLLDRLVAARKECRAHAEVADALADALNIDLTHTATIHCTCGDTSLVATIIKAGGTNRNRIAQLQLADGSQITASVGTLELTEQLGHYLYKKVELRGRAVWNSETWKLHSFRIEGLGNFIERDSDPLGALSQLHQLSQGDWDAIDVGQYLHTLRHSD